MFSCGRARCGTNSINSVVRVAFFILIQFALSNILRQSSRSDPTRARTMTVGVLLRSSRAIGECLPIAGPANGLQLSDLALNFHHTADFIRSSSGGSSSVGRAAASQAAGRGFETRFPLTLSPFGSIIPLAVDVLSLILLKFCPSQSF